jgi:hemerythrin-like domain-containing protein
MTSPLVLHAAPAAGFDEPFEMLDACHRRVERMLSLLARLVAHVAEHGADEAAQRAAADVLRYFDVAAPQHHEDEERHVFPALRTHGQAALAEQLHADHEAMAAGWAALRVPLTAIAGGHTAAPEALARWSDFAVRYARHLQAEEGIAFPAAKAALAASEQAAMGAEMAARRGVRP